MILVIYPIYTFLLVIEKFLVGLFFHTYTCQFSDGIITKASPGGDQFVSIDGKRTYFAIAPTQMPTYEHHPRRKWPFCTNNNMLINVLF